MTTRSTWHKTAIALFCVTALAACNSSNNSTDTPDNSAAGDQIVDDMTGVTTTGDTDSGSTDNGASDAGASDTGSDNTGSSDTVNTDIGTIDTGSTDSTTTAGGDGGATDSTGTSDTGNADSGSTDGDNTDSGSTDSGTTDPGSPGADFDLPADFGPDNATPAPTGISIAVYSNTTAELNWTRPNFSDGIQKNEIWRDGIMIASIPGGGNSYVDATRSMGQAYTYHIVAINRLGRKTTEFLETNGSVANPQFPVIAMSAMPAELKQRLANTFHVLNASAMTKAGAAVLRILESEPADIGLSYLQPTSFADEYTCPEGGVMELEKAETSRTFSARDCGLGPYIINGVAFQIIVNPGEDFQTSLRINDRFSILDKRDNSVITLGFTNIEFNADTLTPTAITTNDFSISGPVYNYKATDLSMSRGLTEFTLNGGAEGYSASGSGLTNLLGQLVRLRTYSALGLGTQVGRPTVGSLVFNSMNIGNETYGINANNTDSTTFTLNATKDGVTTSYNIPWSGIYNLQFKPFAEFDSGF